MQVLKAGGHRLFENDPMTAAVVSEMLLDLETNGMDAVRKYSRNLDDWEPASFELTPAQMADAIAATAAASDCRYGFLPGKRAAFCRGAAWNAVAVGSRTPSGCLARTQTYPGQCRGQLCSRRALPDVRLRANEHHPRQSRRRKDGLGLHASGEGPGLLSGHDQRHGQGRCGPAICPWRCAGIGHDGFRPGGCACGRHPMWRWQQVRRRGQAAALWALRDRSAGRTDRNPRDCRRPRRSGPGGLRSAGPGRA